MKIEHNEICLRDVTAADCKQLGKWWNDGSIMAHAGFPNGLGTTAEEIWEKTKNDSDTTRRRLMILYKGAAIGEMAYFNLGDDTAEIDIKICERNFQEKGLGRLVLSLLLKELFSMGYKKIVLDTNLRNTRAQHVYAQHVYELLGFRKVRIKKDFWKDQVGELQSVVDYELLLEEFVDWSVKFIECKRHVYGM